MACYISSNQNRFYAALESGFGTVTAATAENRIPAIKLGVQHETVQGPRRDKTGSRTRGGIPAGARTRTRYQLGTYMTNWGNITTEPSYGPLIRGALGAAPVLDAGKTVSSIGTNNHVTFTAAHGLQAGQAVSFGGEIRFVAAVINDSVVELNAPFSLVPSGGTPLNPTNPYLKLKTSTGAAGSFAAGYVQGLLPLAVSRAIRAAYWQKWFVHRTLRPEAYGGLVHQRLSAGVDYPLHPDVLQSDAVARNLRKFGSHLISSAYPEGAPLHGSYPGGASVSAAVQATLLKAFFDENATIANPVQPDPADPTRLIPYSGPALTIGGELNKLATNLGVGRNWAGIHWRSDAAASLPLGEEKPWPVPL